MFAKRKEREDELVWQQELFDQNSNLFGEEELRLHFSIVGGLIKSEKTTSQLIDEVGRRNDVILLELQ